MEIWKINECIDNMTILMNIHMDEYMENKCIKYFLTILGIYEPFNKFYSFSEKVTFLVFFNFSCKIL